MSKPTETTQVQRLEQAHLIRGNGCQVQKEAYRSVPTETDTICKANESNLGTKAPSCGKTPPKLPPGKKPPTDYMMLLAQAFSKSYMAMAKTTASQVQSFANEQQASESLTSQILINTQAEAKKATQQLNESIHEEHEAEKMNKICKDLGIASIVVSVALMAIPMLGALVGTAFSAVATGAEVGVDAAESAADTAVTVAEDAAEEASEDAASSAASSSSNSPKGSGGKVLETIENFMKNRVARAFLGLCTGAGLASPELVRGIGSEKIAKELKKLAQAEVALGNSQATLQTNNMYYTFFQQLISKGTSELQGLTSQLQDCLSTYASTIKSYGQISQGLQSAV